MRHGCRLWLPALALLAWLPGRLESQEWRDSRYPYVTSLSNDFPVIAARWLWTRRAPDYFSPLPYAGTVVLDGGISFRGSRFLSAQFRAPGLWDKWRLVLSANAMREARMGYYGLGNDAVYNESLVTPAQPYLYRVHRATYEGLAEVSRLVAPHLYLAAGLHVDHVRFTDLPGPSVFRATQGSEVSQTDAVGRLTAIFDTRDNEYNTHQGVLLETGYEVGSGGNGYTRVYGAARGYVPLGEGTTIAARVVGSNLSGAPPLNARFELPMWEQTLTVYGEHYTNRGLVEGRLAGTGLLFGNLEVRHNILDLQTLGALTAIAFLDAGRVFENEDFRLTTDHMKIGAGGGLAVRILRSTIFTFNFAGGTEGFNFSMGSGWFF